MSVRLQARPVPAGFLDTLRDAGCHPEFWDLDADMTAEEIDDWLERWPRPRYGKPEGHEDVTNIVIGVLLAVDFLWAQRTLGHKGRFGWRGVRQVIGEQYDAYLPRDRARVT